MKKVFVVVLMLSGIMSSHAQNTCTINLTGSINWPASPGNINCVANGTGESIMVIPAGLTVTFNDNGDSWTGTKLIVEGTLIISKSVTIYASIVVNGGGRVSIPGKLALGTSPGCGYTVIVRPGGAVDTSNSASDRLMICGQEIIKGDGGGCNPNYPAGAPPYCDNGIGFEFTGPTAVDEDGYNGTLPVKLHDFTATQHGESVKLQWITSMEENFYKFVVQRSADGLNYEEIGEVKGKGFDIYNIESKYSFMDDAPLTGFNYYRLKAVDLDDTFENFGVKLVAMESAKRLAVYPNPTTGESISFRRNFNAQESDRIAIIDQLGVEVFNGPATGSVNSIAFPNTLRAGIYMLRYTSGDFEQIQRIIVKN